MDNDCQCATRLYLKNMTNCDEALHPFYSPKNAHTPPPISRNQCCGPNLRQEGFEKHHRRGHNYTGRSDEGHDSTGHRYARHKGTDHVYVHAISVYTMAIKAITGYSISTQVTPLYATTVQARGFWEPPPRRT